MFSMLDEDQFFNEFWSRHQRDGEDAAAAWACGITDQAEVTSARAISYVTAFATMIFLMLASVAIVSGQLAMAISCFLGMSTVIFFSRLIALSARNQTYRIDAAIRAEALRREAEKEEPEPTEV